MEFKDLFQQFDWTKLSFFVLFALPGFISLQVWSLISPTDHRPLKDELPEALGFGVLNAAVGGPLVALLAPTNAWYLYLLLLITLVVLPALWPFLIGRLLRKLSVYRLILSRSRNAWDDVFLRREPLFVIVHLKDGRRFGGYYGAQSFAGVHPASGHLYLEVLWSLDDEGRLVAPIPDSKGIILRPDDYHMVELLQVPKETASERTE